MYEATRHCNTTHYYRTFAAVVFTALSLGKASSFTPDASKAQASATRVFALFNRKPPIDTTSPDGGKPVRYCVRVHVCVFVYMYVHVHA